MIEISNVLSQTLEKLNSMVWKKNDMWYSLINQIPNGLHEYYSDNEESLFNIFQNAIDFTKDFEIGYLTDENKDYYWNESVVKIWKDIEDLDEWYKCLDIKEEDTLKYADAGESFEHVKWVIPWENYDKKTYEEIRGNDGFLKVLKSDDNLQFTRSKGNDWIRLIMPKNTRRVEIEDLNRNFWVIGQSLTQLLRYLFDDKSPLKKILPELLSEIAQLNENVMNLWAEYYLMSLKYYSDLKVIYMPLVPNDSDNLLRNGFLDILLDSLSSFNFNYPRYDRMGRTGYSKGLEERLIVSFWDKYSFLVNKYPESNLIIIPYVRDNNYKHNYFSRIILLGALFYDRNKHKKIEEVAMYKFKSPNSSEFEFGISVDIRNNSTVGIPANYVLDNLYGIKEKEGTYRFIKPFSSIDTIEEDEPQRYYGTVRCVPTIDAEYNNGIKIHELRFDFYDAGRQIFEPEVKPMLTLSTKNFIPDFSISDDHLWEVKVLPLEAQENKPVLKVQRPQESDTLNNKLYMGEVLSWYGKTTEIEKWELGDYQTYANTGILIKIGNFLPPISYDSYNDDNKTLKDGEIQYVTYEGIKNVEVRHQSHTISATDRTTEKTAYEVNLTFTKHNKSGTAINNGYLPGHGIGYFNQKDIGKICDYYYPVFNQTTHRWGLRNIGYDAPYNDSNSGFKSYYPCKSDIIKNALYTIRDYIFNDKTSVTEGVFKAGDSAQNSNKSIYEEIDYHMTNSKISQEKVTYFIGTIGANTWDNSDQHYWEKSILFGLFIFIPNVLLTEDLRTKIYKLNEGTLYQTYLEIEQGIIFFRKEINKVEDNFKYNDKTSSFFYYYGNSSWRLPRIFPYEVDISGVEVISQKTKKKHYLPLTAELKELFFSNPEGFKQIVSDNRNNLISQEEFQRRSMENIINKSAGIWTVYDGHTERDPKLEDDKVKSKCLDRNIFKYNEKNTNRQVCYMVYSIDNDELKCNDLLLRQRNESEFHLWRPVYNQRNENFDLLSYNNKLYEDADFYNRADYYGSKDDPNGTDIYNTVWKKGSAYSISMIRSITITDLPYLTNNLLGITLTQDNDVDWATINKSEFDFIMLKAGYSTKNDKFELFIDEKFKDFYDECKQKEIKIGAYWTTGASNKDEAKQEAQQLAQLLNSMSFDYPIYLNFEDTGNENIESIRNDTDNSLSIVKSFIEELESYGYFSGLYVTSLYGTTTGIKFTTYYESLLENGQVWYSYLADISNIDNYNTYGIWQYSDGSLVDIYNDSGDIVRHAVKKLNGIEGDVTRNYCFVNLPWMVENFKNTNNSKTITYTDYVLTWPTS